MSAPLSLREGLKRALPASLRGVIIEARDNFAPPPTEDIVLHDYEVDFDPDPRRRLNLVIPSVAAAKAFGGVVTTIEVFLEIGRRCGADLRVIVDDFERRTDTSVLFKCADRAGLDASAIDILPREGSTPRVTVRPNDIFVGHNWWTILNLQSILDRHEAQFHVRRPFLYLIQDYEPLFYPFSSTHMVARDAYQTARPCWGVFNTHELHDFFRLQGHETDRSFVFEPRLAEGLRPFLAKGPADKRKRLLVYGRPSIARNCYPAIRNGLRLWANQYPRADDWEVVSAGLPHPPVPLSRGKSMTSLGKLPLGDYAELLRETAVGLSLMASPHPSYPPLEMAHFGVRTITNGYTCKDLSTSHPNIVSLTSIDPASIAAALAALCDAFDRDPRAAWAAPTGRPSFLETGPPAFLDEIAAALEADVWAS